MEQEVLELIYAVTYQSKVILPQSETSSYQQGIIPPVERNTNCLIEVAP
jgi:hypothetical protein